MNVLHNWANYAISLNIWWKALAASLLALLVSVSLLYIWGKRSSFVENALKAKFPEGKDPRGWVLFLSRHGPIGKWIASVLAGLFLAVLFILLFFNESKLAKSLGLNYRYLSVAPHLFVQYHHNYADLYLKQDTDGKVENVEDNLVFQNISDKPLTHFQILVFSFAEFHNPLDFYRWYSIDTGKDYLSLGAISVGSLKAQEEYRVSLSTIYKMFADKTGKGISDLNGYLFPTIGESTSCRTLREPQRSNQAYTDKADLLNRFSMQRPAAGGRELDAICGLPLKLEVNYRYGSDQFSSLFVGGNFYYGRALPQGIVPHPIAIASFIKPRLSLSRSLSGSNPQVINMDLEITHGPSSELRDRSFMVYSSVMQPEGDEQLDQLLSITVDENLESRLWDLARQKVRDGSNMVALTLLNRLLNLQPGNVEAMRLKQQLSALSTNTLPSM